MLHPPSSGYHEPLLCKLVNDQPSILWGSTAYILSIFLSTVCTALLIALVKMSHYL
jgi:hypothetical protein